MNEQLINALGAIDVSTLSYQEWINVGFALKTEGIQCSVWDEWSRNDKRYHSGECQRKWETFNGSDTPVTAATIFQMAKDRGWSYSPVSEPIDWNATIGCDDNFDTHSSVTDFRRTLEVLFKVDEYVGYTVESFQDKDGKWKPYGGVFSRTCSELLASLDRYPGDLGATVGDWKEEGGAWLRINALDGSGLGNANVTSYRYALVESDTMKIDDQRRILLQYELPIATLTYSAGKSLHAIVRIDAANLGEYKERVAFLYSFLEGKGFAIDGQNSNPSRLSRLPGATRNGRVQKLIGVNIGTKSWDDWQKALSANTDDLPPVVNLAQFKDNPPALKDVLVEGVLRCGHKMIVTGPSKAGKSLVLMQLAVSAAEGMQWLGFKVKQGRVLYINLEIDHASCIRRFMKIYEALGITNSHMENIDIWNLRGHATPLDKLVPKVLTKIRGKDFAAVIFDPIYKLTMGGDENSASDMGLFCNEFDRVCTETGAAVVYCHHHSKGVQGGKKSMDRSSGSGVFARDPDAVVDMTELEVPENAEYFMGKRGLPAYRIEGTLREFASFKPRNVWFDYPLHRLDYGILDDATVPGSMLSNLAKSSKRKKADTRYSEVSTAYDVCAIDGEVRIRDIAEYLEVSTKTAKRYLQAFPDDFEIDNGVVTRIEDKAPEAAIGDNSNDR